MLRCHPGTHHESATDVACHDWLCTAVVLRKSVLPLRTDGIPLAGVQNANVGSYKQEGFVEVLAATQSPRSTSWFQGTADAVRQYIWLFENAMRSGVEDLLILSGWLGPQFQPQPHRP